MKVYAYKGCDSCRKAIKWLEAQGHAAEVLAIRETPPSVEELKTMLRHYNGDIKKLFNTSGRDYREMNIKEKLAASSEDELLQLLSGNGNLIKRPFLIGESIGLVGFKEALWQETIN